MPTFLNGNNTIPAVAVVFGPLVSTTGLGPLLGGLPINASSLKSFGFVILSRLFVYIIRKTFCVPYYYDMPNTD